MKTLKIKPSHESQGDFVEINEEDFDPKVHELLDGDASTGKPSDGLTVAQIKEALAAKNVTIPEDVTLKADLAALLDSQPA